MADALKERIGNREVRCAVPELDQYGRRISNCEVVDEDLAGWLDSEGLALAYRRFSERFVPEASVEVACQTHEVAINISTRAHAYHLLLNGEGAIDLALRIVAVVGRPAQA